MRTLSLGRNSRPFHPPFCSCETPRDEETGCSFSDIASVARRYSAGFLFCKRSEVSSCMRLLFSSALTGSRKRVEAGVYACCIDGRARGIRTAKNAAIQCYAPSTRGVDRGREVRWHRGGSSGVSGRRSLGMHLRSFKLGVLRG